MFTHQKTWGRTARAVFGVMALTATMLTVTAPVVLGGGDGKPCRIRNVTQSTEGRALTPMVRAAKDGDALRVRGTCAGGADIAIDLSIRGVGAEATIDGRDLYRVLRIRAGATVSLERLVIARGSAHKGAGVLNRGTLIMAETTVRDNWAHPVRGRSVGVGGGIANGGLLILRNSMVRGNKASQGGGIDNSARGTLTISATSVVGNAATQFVDNYGGGIRNLGVLIIADSTVSRNQATSQAGFSYGGGIFNAGILTVTNSTVSGNSVLGDNGGGGGGIAYGDTLNERPGHLSLHASTVTANVAGSPGRGGGIYDGGFGSTAIVGSTIVAGNTVDDNDSSSGADCAGQFDSSGDNLIGVRQGCRGFRPFADGDLVGTRADPTDPRLGPLSKNGGFTKTHALREGSPAIDAAERFQCSTPRDQRGVERPQREACDIGAFERR